MAGCGGDAESDSGVRAVSVDNAADLFDNQPEDLIILDVRTPDEFNAGHLDGAVMIDFYESDFADRIADLDRDQPYLMYCRSGNRSGAASELMDELGFTNVAHVDGGILAWLDAGEPIVQ